MFGQSYFEVFVELFGLVVMSCNKLLVVCVAVHLSVQEITAVWLPTVLVTVTRFVSQKCS